ncbi:MAG: radical SAM protein [Bacteroidales bacterium]|nr:radical SAM protein [Bacteroidales bacterium]
MTCLKESSVNILIQPTDSCNLDCLYCYKGDKSSSFMTEDLMLKILAESISYNSNRNNPTLFIWHGGEPSILPTDFYHKAFDFTSSNFKGQKITHTIQTNGFRLREDLMDLCIQNNVSISISLDGPAHYHDRIRFTKDGKGTHDSIMKNIEKAQKKGIELGILMSITNDNLSYIRDMFDFCKQNGFSFGINPITSDLFSKHDGLEVSPENYLQACIEVYDLWFNQQDNLIRVNPGFGITQLILSQNRISDCFLSENCQMTFISIDSKGNVYPCNRFDNNEQYKFGNINEQKLEEIMKSPIRLKLLKRSAEYISKCQNCKIRKYCNGGCMHHAISHFNELNAPDHLCDVYIGLIEHAMMQLNKSLTFN